MKLTTFAFAVLVLMYTAKVSAKTTLQATLHSRFSDSEITNILRESGYTTRVVSAGVLIIYDQGQTHYLRNLADGDLRTITAYNSVNDMKLDYKDMNTWNSKKRLSRAFLDDAGDPVIEADYLSNGGISAAHLIAFIEVYLQTTDDFESFIFK